MEGFTEILRNASAAIPVAYFLLPLDGAAPVYRERVYCYELYHQMRCMWPDETPYRLNGELDKRNHPYFEAEEQPKPDLLVHQPGVGDNFAAIEVKAAGAANRETRKDLSSLVLLARRAGYRRLIYLIYGEGSERDVERITTCAAEQEDAPPIELWLHSAQGIPATVAEILRSAQQP
jgi:hypothetical protein